MQYDKTNFFHHFAKSKPKNYSDSEIRFVLEVVARVKVANLTYNQNTDKQINKLKKVCKY